MSHYSLLYDFLGDINPILDSTAKMEDARRLKLEAWGRSKLTTMTLMCTLNCDPFSVYRNDYKIKSMHYRLHNKPQFRLGEDRFSRFKRRTREVFPHILVYWWIKYTCFIIGQQTAGNMFELNPGGWLKKVTSFMESVTGNPFYKSHEYGNVVPYFIMNQNLSLLHILFIIPYQYARRPMDSLIMRVLLEPRREQQRIDAAINEKISSMCRQSRSISHRRLEADTELLRPATYNLDWQRPWTSKILPAFCLYWMLASPTAFGFIPTIIYKIESARCDEVEQSGRPCRLFEDFTLAQFMTAFELTCSVYSFTTVTILYLLLGVAGIFNLLIIAKDVKRDMNRCLEVLRLYNHSITTIQPRSLLTEKQISEDLLKNYIRLSMSSYEIKRGAKFSSEVFASVGIIYAFAGAFSLLSATSQENNLQIFWQFMFLSLWFVTNLYVLMAAYSFARICEIEKFGWSMLAQLAIRDRWRKQALGHDYITTRWNKLILGLSLSHSENKIKPYNVPLTYKTLIQLNFLIISILILFGDHH